jgi:hypothetical protein
VDAAQEWELQARLILSMSKDGASAALVGVQQLRWAIGRGERSGLQLPSLPRLHDVLRAHDKWESRVRELMATAGARTPYAELRVFQHTARGSPVTSALRAHIGAAMAAVEGWSERCRRSVAKRNTGTRLDVSLDMLAHSVDCGVEQFERRLEVEKRLVSGGGRRPGPPGGDGGPEDERELYCLCQQPYHVDTAMISCDACGEWYHMRCVGVTQTQARTLKKYSCPICAAVRVSPPPPACSPLPALLRRRRRPRAPLEFVVWVRGRLRPRPPVTRPRRPLRRRRTTSTPWRRR